MFDHVEKMSSEEKDIMFSILEDSIESEKSLKREASWFELRDVAYKLVYTREVPNTPLIRYFMYTYEFCRYR